MKWEQRHPRRHSYETKNRERNFNWGYRLAKPQRIRLKLQLKFVLSKFAEL